MPRLDDFDTEGYHLILLFYKVEADMPEIQLSKEHSEYRWVTRKELHQIIENSEKIKKGILIALEKLLK
jgi:hypothetical protein